MNREEPCESDRERAISFDVHLTSPLSKTPKTVRFSHHGSIIDVPSREEYADIATTVWWMKSELNASSNQANIAIREAMLKNPSLTVESAMCLMYQAPEMFDSRVRLLIVDTEASSATAIRNTIITSQRSNIWTVQCCAYDTAMKVIERGRRGFDMVVIHCPKTNQFVYCHELACRLRKSWGHDVILGVIYVNADENDRKFLAAAKLDFLWTEPLSEDILAPPYLHLKKLLASRHLRCKEESPILPEDVMSSADLQYSYPVGYRITPEKMQRRRSL